ncbi:MAG: hypothetical protein GXO31_07525 [Epsilonproteobacteria bacterium]|nr:hypothetical protein [Campylobacterota bacterium]
MKKSIYFLLISSLFATDIKLIKNSALIFYQGNRKEIIILRNVEQMEANIKRKRVDVTLFLVSGKSISLKNLSFKAYKNLENTLTNNTMRILKEIK